MDSKTIVTRFLKVHREILGLENPVAGSALPSASCVFLGQSHFIRKSEY